jgi:ubiquinone/menaquinone biosynthesis C-methylase UbiE
MRINNPGAVIENSLRDKLLGNYFNSRKKSGTLLDLGCGPRPYFNLYASHFDKTLGADLPDSPFPKENIDIYCSATSIPLENNSIDAVLSTEVMHDISEPREMLREVNRILKPGGHIILTTPFVVPTVDGVYDHYRYTEQGLRYLLTSENFEIQSITPVSDVIGAFVTLGVKPWLRFWNQLSKLLHLKIIYTAWNPLFLLTVLFPQILYLWSIPLLKGFYKKFSYGCIGFVTIGVKKTAS